jgi:hypothetical protein
MTKKIATTRQKQAATPTNQGKKKSHLPRRVAPQAPVTPPAQHTKKAIILALLKRPEGATLEELMGATGWQAHSVRGFISGTVKKSLGLLVERERDHGGITSYKTASPK